MQKLIGQRAGRGAGRSGTATFVRLAPTLRAPTLRAPTLRAR
jgi:hypothetical protein